MDETIASPNPIREVDVHDLTIALDSESIKKAAARSSVKHGFPTIDGYRIESILGKGGMGIVYRAVQVKLKRTVALKVLPAVVGAANEALVSRFRREAMSAARLHHTNIIPVYDYGEVADGYYYAMELVDGSPLDEIVRRMSGESGGDAITNQRLTQFLADIHTTDGANVTLFESHPSEATRTHAGSSPMAFAATIRSRQYFRQVSYWFADVAEALDYAHGQGIIHRDIKPSNLILSKDGRLMVADFGLAKDVDDVGVTRDGAIIGTARYLSPEQARGGAIDHRTDIYSLGSTMYELLCFQPAYPEEDQRKLIAQVLSTDPRRPRTILPLIPPELETICLKAMEKTVEARYPNGKSFADEIRRYLNDLPIAARRPSFARRTWKFVKRHRVVLTIVTTLCIALFAGINYVHQRHQKQKAWAQTLAESGLNLANFAEWEEAEKEFQRALEIYPASLETRLNMVWMYIKQSSTADAQTAKELLKKGTVLCEWVLAREPNNVSARNFYGVCLKRLGEYAAAAEQFLKVLEHRQFYAALSNLGACYAVLGENENAGSYLRKAAANEEALKKNEWVGAAWRNLAVFENHRQNPKAREYIEQSLSKNHADPMSLIVRAKILMGDQDQNIEQALNDAVTADGVSVEGKVRVRALVKRVRAIAHLRSGEYTNAARYAGEALSLGDDRTGNLLVLAIANARLGKTTEAENALEEAGKVWPRPIRRPGSILVTAEDDWLWYDFANELRSLEKEARAAIAESRL